MNRITEVVTCWKYRGNRLANPLVIARRLIVYPFLVFAVAITCAIAALGFGADAGKDIWKEIF